MEKLKRIFEDLFDEIGDDIITDGNDVMADDRTGVGADYDPDSFEYVMSFSFYFINTYARPNEDFVLDLPQLYADVEWALRCGPLDGEFAVSPFRIHSTSTRYDDITFEFPYTEKVYLPEICGGSEFRSSLNSMTLLFSVYFNGVDHISFGPFVTRWRAMLTHLDKTFERTGIIYKGELTGMHENREDGQKCYVSNMYTDGYNHNHESFVNMYRMFFGEEIDREYDKYTNVSLERMLRRLRFDEISKRGALSTGEPFSVEFIKCSFRNKGLNSSAYAVFRVTSPADTLDCKDVITHFIRGFFSRIPSCYFHFVKFAVFIITDKNNAHIINSADDPSKRSRAMTTYTVLDGTGLETRVTPFTYYRNGRKQKEPRFVNMYFKKTGSSDTFFMYIGDKDGQLGKTPIEQKSYGEWGFRECFRDVLDEIYMPLWEK